MRRTGQPSREPALFDLPLVVDPGLADEADRSVKAVVRRKPSAPEAEQIELPAEAAGGGVFEDRGSHLPESLIRRRFMAGIFDTGVSGVALAVLIVGAMELGVPARVGDWPAYLLTILVFSFIYVVFSLTFWDKTPGMIRARLVVNAQDGDAPGTRHAVLRWLGGLATVLLLGLPTLLSLRERRSLADQLSGSRLELS